MGEALGAIAEKICLAACEVSGDRNAAIVRMIESANGSPSLVESVGTFIGELKAPLRKA